MKISKKVQELYNRQSRLKKIKTITLSEIKENWVDAKKEQPPLSNKFPISHIPVTPVVWVLCEDGFIFHAFFDSTNINPMNNTGDKWGHGKVLYWKYINEDFSKFGYRLK